MSRERILNLQNGLYGPKSEFLHLPGLVQVQRPMLNVRPVEIRTMQSTIQPEVIIGEVGRRATNVHLASPHSTLGFHGMVHEAEKTTSSQVRALSHGGK